VIRCRVDCSADCECCGKRRKFIPNWALYDHHIQITPTGLVQMLEKGDVMKRVEDDGFELLQYMPFTMTLAWVDLMTSVSCAWLGMRSSL
jgi:hypothetical protein